MNWDDLRVFLAVARTESLSGAGRQLRIDAATVGRRIARLETATGAPLFVRSQRGYSLTNIGARLLVHAERAENVTVDAANDLTGQAGHLSGQVRIGATDGCASYVLPQVCARITKDHPELEIQIVALPRVINLSKREADIAITVSPPEAGRVTVQKITDYHLHLAASRAYLEQNRPIERKRDLKGHPLVGYIQDLLVYPELDFLDIAGPAQLSLSSNLVSVQLAMLRQGGGVGVTHDFVLPYAPELTKILVDEISIRRSYYLLRHEADARVGRFDWIAQQISEGVANEVARLEKGGQILSQ